MQTTAGNTADFTQAVLKHMALLTRLACLQLGEDGHDAAQETLIAALASHERYAAQSSVRAWLLGILRHKIIDAIRLKKKFHAIILDDLIAEYDIQDMFTPDGSWNPENFNPALCPSATTERQQLLDIIELCLQALPEKNASIFLMREYLGFDIEEIAHQTRLTPGHIRVTLHRARLKLRACTVNAWGDEYAS